MMNDFYYKMWTKLADINTLTRLFVFYITLIELEKAWIQLFSLNSEVHIKAHWAP